MKGEELRGTRLPFCVCFKVALSDADQREASE